jgi:hypothetical protein
VEIKLRQIIPIENPHDYKLHLACWNRYEHPLDVFVRDKEEWKGWNEWKGSKNDFSRKYIFSLIAYYHEYDQYLFGGIFEVLERNGKRYILKLLPDFQEMIGRLKISLHRYQGLRGRAFNFESHIDKMVCSELLKEPYAGERFCGYENVNHDFSTLEIIFRNNREDWRAALENVKGVYLIVDKSNGKKYVGSAYGDAGIWSRWGCYIGTGHGWNDELTTLIKKEGFEYARKNFKFSILEYRSMRTDDSTIINRESYWKEVLITRGAFGYNKN